MSKIAQISAMLTKIAEILKYVCKMLDKLSSSPETIATANPVETPIVEPIKQENDDNTENSSNV